MKFSVMIGLLRIRGLINWCAGREATHVQCGKKFDHEQAYRHRHTIFEVNICILNIRPTGVMTV